MRITDQIGNSIYFKQTPKRIISLVPSITELLVDLGLQNNIVGITKFCVHPKTLKKEKTTVGGTKKCKIDSIKSLSPDLIICNKEENTKEIVLACKEISATYVSDIATINDVLQLVEDFGVIFSIEEKSSHLKKEIQKKVTDFTSFIKNKNQQNVAYFIWKNPYMVAASNTFISSILELNHFKNIFITKERYPEVTLSELKNNDDLDIVLLSSEPYPFKEKDCEELSELLNTHVILVDGEYFSWYGSRLLKAFDYFKKLRKTLDSNFSV